ncbi:hypothetical protein BDW62DRAFT_200881 [Aspergillus aurantiobrunneus]
MARFAQGWLVASFVFLFQIANSLVFDEVPAADVVPAVLHARASEDSDFSMLDLLKRDSFYWTGTQNGHRALANLTIDLPGDDETVISLDRFKHLVRSVQCTNKTMTVGLKNDKAYNYIKQGWQWLNDVDPHKLVVVAAAGECGWNPTRMPFSASTVQFDDVANTASLVGKTISWKEFQNYELTVGNYKPVATSALAQRDVDETMSLPFDIPIPFPSGKLNTPVDNLALTWFCPDCGTKGSFDFGFHIETKFGIPTDASISLSPNGVSALLNPRIAIQSDLTGDIDDEWEIGTVPIAGISIPGDILDVGPQVVFSLGYSVGPLQGSAGVTTGVTVTIPDEAELEIALLDPDLSSEGWDADVQTENVTLDARVTGDALVYVKAAVDLSFEALGLGFQAGVNLKPYVGAGFMAQASSGEVCEGESDPYGIKVYPKAGVALSADVAKASEPEDPLVEAVFASVTASGLPTYCTAWGGASSTAVPSSSESASSTPQPVSSTAHSSHTSAPSTSKTSSRPSSSPSTSTPHSTSFPIVTPSVSSHRR